MTPEIKQYLKDLGKTAYGQALVKYLELKYEEIGDITQCRDLDDMLGRQRALKLVKEVFAFLGGDNPKIGESQKPRYD